MMCQACEDDDHANCGMQSWCECDCGGYHDIGMPEPDWEGFHFRVMDCGHTPEECSCDPTPEQEDRAARDEWAWDHGGEA